MSTTLKDDDASTKHQLRDDGPVADSEWWLPAVDDAPPASTGGRARSREDHAPSSSPPPRRGTKFNGTTQSQKRSASLARSGSRKSTHTTEDGREVPGSAFVSGAGTTGPSASLGPDEEEALKMRGAEAEGRLTEKQKEKVRKEGWLILSGLVDETRL